MNDIVATETKHYTAEDFIRSVEDAIKEMSSFRKNAMLSFTGTIAADAADLANEKRLDKDFVFITDFTDALFSAFASETVSFSHDIFVSTDRMCRISVQYRKSGAGEEYHITLVDAVSKKAYTYAGKMEISDTAEKYEEAGSGISHVLPDPEEKGSDSDETCSRTKGKVIICFIVAVTCAVGLSALSTWIIGTISLMLPPNLAALFKEDIFIIIRAVLFVLVAAPVTIRIVERVWKTADQVWEAADMFWHPEKMYEKQDAQEQRETVPPVRKDSSDTAGPSGGLRVATRISSFYINLDDCRDSKEPCSAPDDFNMADRNESNNRYSVEAHQDWGKAKFEVLPEHGPCYVRCDNCAHSIEFYSAAGSFNDIRLHKCLTYKDNVARWGSLLCRRYEPKTITCRSCHYCNIFFSGEKICCAVTHSSYDLRHIDVPHTCKFYDGDK